jgi:hypothetical protein
MFTGTVDGGFELLPGFDVQFTPHERLGALEMYPFMDAGAFTTPENELFFQYCEPQKFTLVPLIVLPLTVPSAVRSPTTKPPDEGRDAVVSVADVLDDW